MKSLKKIIILWMAASVCAMLALPAAAATTTSRDDGLEVTVEMDKEQYSPGEEITAKITVKNTGATEVTIANLEQLIPEGYRLSDDSRAAAENIELRPGQTFELEVTYGGGAVETETVTGQGFLEKLLYGETMGIPNLLIAVVLLIAFAIFMFLT